VTRENLSITSASVASRPGLSKGVVPHFHQRRPVIPRGRLSCRN
jgi:hypothetical protein